MQTLPVAAAGESEHRQRRLIYSSSRGVPADADLHWQPADRSGTSELLSSLDVQDAEDVMLKKLEALKR